MPVHLTSGQVAAVTTYLHAIATTEQSNRQLRLGRNALNTATTPAPATVNTVVRGQSSRVTVAP
jgi:hypothetical protein